MIVAAGLTPTWQQIVALDRLRIGGVNRAREVHWRASGKAINVGIALAHFGVPCELVSLLGGPNRESIEREIEELIDTRWVVTLAQTRVSTTILDASAAGATELVEPAGAVQPSELAEFERIFAVEAHGADVVVLSGSLPEKTPPTFYRELLGKTDGKVVLDARGEELLEALAAKPLLIKPNRQELADTVGLPLDDDSALVKAMRELNERGAQWVVVSDEHRPVWVSGGGKVYRIEVPSAEQVVNPVGCGDTMAAGIAVALRDKREPLDAVRFGVAAAVENLSTMLPGRIDPAKVAQRLESIRATTV